jgi:hypothetical protein
MSAEDLNICRNCRVLVNFTIILYQCEGFPLIDTVCAVSAVRYLQRVKDVDINNGERSGGRRSKGEWTKVPLQAAAAREYKVHP